MFRILAFNVILSCLAFQLHAQTKSVLFLGNSYTYVNDLPQLISDLASSNGDSLIFDSNTPGGYTLQSHSTDPVSMNKIQSRKWDFVVLQEQSQRPSFPPAQVQSDVYPYASALDQMIRQNDSCTKTMFYMTWGRKHGDQQNCQFYSPLCSYQGMQRRLRESYVEMAVLNNASVAPVGMAWKYSIANDSNLNLYSADESHPSIYGSYLAACVFYCSLYHKSSVGLFRPTSVSASTAYILQNIADASVFDSLSTWRIDTTTSIHPVFSYVKNGMSVDFTDNSGLVGASYQWDFGDGNGSQVQNPSHTYLQNGTYQVRLTIDQNCDQGLTEEEVQIGSSHIEEQNENGVSFFPNPVKQTLHLDFRAVHNGAEVVQLNVLGQPMQSMLLEGAHQVEFDLLGPKGVYFIQVLNGSQSSTFKIFKE